MSKADNKNKTKEINDGYTKPPKLIIPPKEIKENPNTKKNKKG